MSGRCIGWQATRFAKNLIFDPTCQTVPFDERQIAFAPVYCLFSPAVSLTAHRNPIVVSR